MLTIEGIEGINSFPIYKEISSGGQQTNLLCSSNNNHLQVN